jgi:PIN domain nuclease of toxin-antitoxin system
MLLLDTHVWVWSFFDPAKLSVIAKDAISNASALYISPISVYEVSQKVRLGKWSEMADHLGLLRNSPFILSATMTDEIADLAGSLEWGHRDPFDRMIAATAMDMKCSLVSKDGQFDDLKSVAGWKPRIW